MWIISKCCGCYFIPQIRVYMVSLMLSSSCVGPKILWNSFDPCDPWLTQNSLSSNGVSEHDHVLLTKLPTSATAAISCWRASRIWAVCFFNFSISESNCKWNMRKVNNLSILAWCDENRACSKRGVEELRFTCWIASLRLSASIRFKSSRIAGDNGFSALASSAALYKIIIWRECR